jgi:hypothetical protein
MEDLIDDIDEENYTSEILDAFLPHLKPTLFHQKLSMQGVELIELTFEGIDACARHCCRTADLRKTIRETGKR